MTWNPVDYLSGYTSSLFFLCTFHHQAFILCKSSIWEMTLLATMEKCELKSFAAAALIDSETVATMTGSKSFSTSSCHCPPSKHIVAPLSLVFPSFLKKKALHVLWYKKVDHSSWAVKRTLLLLLLPLVVVILIVFFSLRTKELVHTCPMANQ